jgi:hypothetical protein
VQLALSLTTFLAWKRKMGVMKGEKMHLFPVVFLSLSLSPYNLLTVLHKILFLTFLLCIFIVVKWQNGDEVPE